MAKVLVCDPMADGPMEKMYAIPHLEVTYSPDVTPEELLTAVKGMHAMVVRSRTKVTEEIIDAFDEMKVIVRGGVGVDNIKVDYAASKGVETKNTPAASSQSVAELAMAMMFALARKIVPATNSMQAGTWDKKAFKGCEVGGKVLGLVGLGRIARFLGKMGHALGMTVIGYDPYVKAEDVTEFPVKGVGLEQIMAESDFISLHVPHTEETHHMLDMGMLAKMKPTAFLIDCSRGGVRDDSALAALLTDGKIAGAGLDVFEKEPPESNPFAGMANVVLAPHQGAQTAEGQSRVGYEVVEILDEYFK
ncbi:hydroxyacid dehydrogenase [bacterium]|nr:hydroxyacid dehydrogenase [bacterium]